MNLRLTVFLVGLVGMFLCIVAANGSFVLILRRLEKAKPGVLLWDWPDIFLQRDNMWRLIGEYREALPGDWFYLLPFALCGLAIACGACAIFLPGSLP